MIDEYNSIRYAILIDSTDIEKRIKGYTGMLNLFKNTNYWSNYQSELLTNLRNDSISSMFEADLLTEKLALVKKSSSEISEADMFLVNSNTKSQSVDSFKIKEYSKEFYNKGVFSNYIVFFNKFIVSLKNEITENELHSYLIKYVISSIIKKQHDLAISEITKLKSSFHNFDISIYIFFLKVIQGKFHQAEEDLLNISRNIYSEFFEKILNEESLSFYIMIILLVNYKKHVFYSIQTNSNCFGYKIYESSPEVFEILECFSKCKFSKICIEFEGIKDKLRKDSFLEEHVLKMNKFLKENIILFILKGVNSISFRQLSEIVKESEGFIENTVGNMILSGQVSFRIDGINRIINYYDVSIDSVLSMKVIENSNRTYNKLINSIINKNQKEVKCQILSRDEEYVKKKIVSSGLNEYDSGFTGFEYGFGGGLNMNYGRRYDDIDSD